MEAVQSFYRQLIELEGYKIVIDNVDEVIRIIRASKSIADAKEQLCARFELDDVQATAIVQMQLGRLSGLEREKIEAEYEGVLAKIGEYEAILADESKVFDIIKEVVDQTRRFESWEKIQVMIIRYS